MHLGNVFKLNPSFPPFLTWCPQTEYSNENRLLNAIKHTDREAKYIFIYSCLVTGYGNRSWNYDDHSAI